MGNNMGEAGRRMDATSRQDATESCEPRRDRQDASGHCNPSQDSLVAGDAEATSVAPGRNGDAPDARNIFAYDMKTPMRQ